MTQEEREKLREQIRQDVEAFLDKGGKITKVPSGMRSDVDFYSDKDEV